MTIWVLDRGAPDWEAQQLVRHAELSGHTAKYIDVDKLRVGTEGLLVSGQLQLVPSTVFVRSQVITRAAPTRRAADLAVLDLLEGLGARLINSAHAIHIHSNKLLSARMLCERGIPTPRTSPIRSLKELERVAEQYRLLVAKVPYGHASVDVLAIGVLERDSSGRLNERELIHAFHLLQREGELCLQEMIGNDERDFVVIRIATIGQTVAACYELSSSTLLPFWPGQSVVELEQHALKPSVDLVALCREVNRRLGLNTSTIELVRHGEGYSVIEVNPVVSTWEHWGPHAQTDIDPAQLHIDMISHPTEGNES